MTKMGKRYTKEELESMESLAKEGLTDGEIAQRLNRSEDGIRNIRYRKKLAKEAQLEIGTLQTQEAELRNAVEALNDQKQELSKSLESLKKEKEQVETWLNIDKLTLQYTLTQALTALKQQRPDLFRLSEQEQIALFLKELFSV
jgi:hypothetical protein